MTNVNTDLYIHLKSSTDNATAREKITGKTGTYDLYYIENWTLSFDIKIIFLTFLTGFINKNAY